MQTAITRLSTGIINTVNDTLPGGGGGNIGPQRGLAPGQAGATFQLGDDNVIYDASIGVVYGGLFQYVKLSAASAQPARGQNVFWDDTDESIDYTVTTLESGTTPGAQKRAGIVLNPNWTPGNWSVIQVLGKVAVKFIAALTDVPAGVGVAVYAAAKGAGADNGLSDVVNSADPTTFGDVGLLQTRFLGSSVEVPTNGGTKLVDLVRANPRG